METAFYLAGQEVTEKLNDMMSADDSIRRRGKKLAKSLGAKNCYWDSSWNGRQVVGFQFSEPPGKRFVRLKGTNDGWRPRASRENRSLIDEMATLCTGGPQAIGELVGLKTGQCRFDGSSGALRMSGGAGLERVGKQYILEVNKRDGKPVGCTRISDIEREELVSSAKKRQAG